MRALESSVMAREDNSLATELSTKKNARGSAPKTKVKQKSSSAGVPLRFKCDLCPRMFKYDYCRRNHYRVHTDDMPFKCGVKGCEKRFKWRKSRVNHVQQHHPEVLGETSSTTSRTTEENSPIHSPIDSDVCVKQEAVMWSKQEAVMWSKQEPVMCSTPQIDTLPRSPRSPLECANKSMADPVFLLWSDEEDANAPLACENLVEDALSTWSPTWEFQ